MERTSRLKVVLGAISLAIVLVASVYKGELAHAALSFDLIPNWFNFGHDWQQVSIKLLDYSNDDAAELSTHELLSRAGFEYENHYALADDGYVTQLIRIINPLADRSHLRTAPILLIHGQTSNSRNFVMQSNSQHRPMRWPLNSGRRKRSEPAKDSIIDLASILEEREKSNWLRPVSSNRSLALMLANNGYDVWLASTRGSDPNNRGFVPNFYKKTLRRGLNRYKNMSSRSDILLKERMDRNSYWSFTLDDQIEYELPSQVATVLNSTGASKITMIGFSNSAMTILSMLAARPDVAERVDTYIGIAPVTYYNKLRGWFQWFLEGIIPLMPHNLDADLFISDKAATFARRVLIRGCANLPARYTICKYFLDLLFGPSPRFQTNLEPPFFGHLIWPTSWRCMAQHFQHIKSHRMAKFDYGPKLNQRYYGYNQPPEYRIEDINPEVNIGLVSGAEDAWANQATLDETRNRLSKKPELDLVLKEYNHLDLAGAFEVDVRVNTPILEFLNERDHKLSSGVRDEFEEEEASFVELNRRNELTGDSLRFLATLVGKNGPSTTNTARDESYGLFKMLPAPNLNNPIQPIKDLLNLHQSLSKDKEKSAETLSSGRSLSGGPVDWAQESIRQVESSEYVSSSDSPDEQAEVDVDRIAADAERDIGGFLDS